MSKATETGKRKDYELKITLLESDPPIWRLVRVPADIRLSHLHRVIQIAMGWEDDHLHQFVIKGASYMDFGRPGPDIDTQDEDATRLSEVVTRVNTKLRYWYDFGDDWWHEIQLKRMIRIPPDEKIALVCVDGAGACPPEDCGGVWGYYTKLDILEDPEHPDHPYVAEWMGEDFDPDAFDREAVNQRLERLARHIR
ncbi:MAG: plasmid pRiA4b ORF-3 family protein [Planctomycetota bacterium]